MTSSRSRNAWLLTAEKKKLISILAKHFSQNSAHDDALIISPDIEVYRDMPAISCQQTGNLLGQEKQIVIIDLFDQICVDAIAIAAGLVVGGGHLVFCLPEETQWSMQYRSLFSQRLLKFLSMEPIRRLNLQQFETQLATMCLSLSKQHEFILTPDQQQVIRAAEALTDRTETASLVVVADRGRGKSTSIGLAAAKLMQNQDITILVAAPSFKSASVAFEHARMQLEINKIKQARLEYGKSVCQFVAPDELLQQQPEADLIFIDEAAAIPLPLLIQIVKRYSKTIFVSTVHGYEGTGRGFFVRFFKALDECLPAWQKIEMKQPVRWSMEDRVESWLFKLLCLDAELQETIDSIDLSAVNVIKLQQQDLYADEKKLSSIFALLVMAHYRTRPSDLQRLLDDPVEIRVVMYGQQMIAAMVSLDEGELDQSLASQVYKGERRPPGNLLAQTLSYHCGIEKAATHRLHRVMRIVVHPMLQGQGIGRLLISNLIESCQQRQIDILGASFGYTDVLANFWQQQDFQLLRLGFSREQSSGERAGLFVRPLTGHGTEIVTAARRRFEQHFSYLKKTVLKDVKLEIEGNALLSDEMTEDDWQDLQSFIKTDRGYELCIAGINKWLLKQESQWATLDKNQVALINEIIINNTSWKQAAINLQLQGKKQAQSLFKKVVITLREKMQ